MQRGESFEYLICCLNFNSDGICQEVEWNLEHTNFLVCDIEIGCGLTYFQDLGVVNTHLLHIQALACASRKTRNLLRALRD